MKLSQIRPRQLIALGLAALLTLLACSKQSEGERCSESNDDEDCESGLICVSPRQLRSSEVARCCPPETGQVSDSRCTRLVGGGSETGTGNTAGAAGEGNEPSTSTTGSSGCSYDSQCPEGMICGPAGMCQAECLTPRDCPALSDCVAGRCVANGSAGAGG